MPNHTEIDQILMRYLQNESDAEERITTEKWISEKQENYLYFENFRKAHIQLQWTVQAEAIKGNYSQWQHKIHRRIQWHQLYRIAALIIIILGAGISAYFIYYTNPSTDYTLADSSIQPGSSQAILHLSTGQSVEIQQLKEELKEKDGTSIHISENGTLNYIQSSSSNLSDHLQNKLEIPRGGEFKLNLSDGTEVWLNSESELEYPTTFTGTQRIVNLKGEAYFKVAKNSQCPFMVNVGEIKIKVYGTQFNINTQNKGKIETVLISGSVSLIHKDQEIRLKPSQMAEYITSSGQTIVKDVNTLPHIAWKDGNFMFHNESLEAIMEKLARWYDLKIFYIHNDIKSIRLSGTLERYRDVSDLFRHFEKISSARFTVKGKTVTIE